MVIFRSKAPSITARIANVVVVSVPSLCLRRIPPVIWLIPRKNELVALDAKTVTRKPKESEALQLMANYYKAHKAELPKDIHKHRNLLVDLLMEGMSPEEAFQMVRKICYEGWPG